MTTKTIHYDTRPLMKTGKKREASNGFRSIHTNFTNNDERQGFDVDFDDTPDAPPVIRQLTERQLLDELAKERDSEII